MPLYSYTALTEAGVRVTGEGVAASVQELTQELTGKGLLIQQIRQRRAGLKLFQRERIKPEDFLLFNQEFMALVRAGLTIPEALQLAANRPDNPGLGRILQRVLEDVRGGVILSEACARHRKFLTRCTYLPLKPVRRPETSRTCWCATRTTCAIG